MTDMPSGSEQPTSPTASDAEQADELRQHAQEPAEGPDDASERRPDVPRVHPDDPAEG